MNTAGGGFLKRIFTTFASPYGGHVLSGGRSSGSRAPLGAGNANNGDIDGLAYFNGNNAPSNANANLSSPHYLESEGCVCLSALFEGCASAHAGTYTIKQVLVGRCGDSKASVRRKADTKTL